MHVNGIIVIFTIILSFSTLSHGRNTKSKNHDSKAFTKRVTSVTTKKRCSDKVKCGETSRATNSSVKTHKNRTTGKTTWAVKRFDRAKLNETKNHQHTLVFNTFNKLQQSSNATRLPKFGMKISSPGSYTAAFFRKLTNNMTTAAAQMTSKSLVQTYTSTVTNSKKYSVTEKMDLFKMSATLPKKSEVPAIYIPKSTIPTKITSPAMEISSADVLNLDEFIRSTSNSINTATPSTVTTFQEKLSIAITTRVTNPAPVMTSLRSAPAETVTVEKMTSTSTAGTTPAPISSTIVTKAATSSATLQKLSTTTTKKIITSTTLKIQLTAMAKALTTKPAATTTADPSYADYATENYVYDSNSDLPLMADVPPY
ncbi:uncharacterized protein LOC132203448 [Neocloeon triangulifer]|uniref:uncharacterized protein LOC132203448 n=1 Tax=Neocloeon triangulifer TaxID=2078957 RepID=UPI00286F67FE|nr:uncharacterized protein LOC132203448 [Neocloeon triangulifer]